MQQSSTIITSDNPIHASNAAAVPTTGKISTNGLSGETFGIGNEAQPISVCRRIYALFSILLMAVNTFSTAETITRTVATATYVPGQDFSLSPNDPDTIYFGTCSTFQSKDDDYLCTQIYDVQNHGCTRGAPSLVSVECLVPLGAGTTGSTALIIIWALYFSMLLLLRLYETRSYATNDLRFYIAIDKCNSHIINCVLVYFGMFYTIFCLCVVIYYTIRGAGNISGITSGLVFMGVNISVVYPLLVPDYINEKIAMVDFPQPIIINVPAKRTIYNLYGGITPLKDVFQMLFYACLAGEVQSDWTQLDKYGKRSELIGAVRLILPHLKKIDKKEDQRKSTSFEITTESTP